MPLKVKIFIWLAMRNSMLTKGNILRKGWTGNPRCHFYGVDESVRHLLFECTLARLIWHVIAYDFDMVRPLDDSDDMMGVWIESFPMSQMKLVLCGCAAV
jgi:hypothetical protein